MRYTILGCLLAVLSTVSYAQTPSLERLKTYVEIDTTNPPGNESRGVEFWMDVWVPPPG